MKKIIAIFITTSLLLLSVSVKAQIGLISIEKVQALLDKTVGQKEGMTTITKQVITTDSYTYDFTASGGKLKGTDKSTNIQWSKGFIFASSEETETLTSFVFKFTEKFTYNERLNGDDEEETTVNTFTFYVMTKDAAEMKALIKAK